MRNICQFHNMIKPSLPKGFRDHLPEEGHKREFILSAIQDAFHRYGFQHLETPLFESIKTLTEKYGEEGDQLLFKVLRSGDFLQKADQEALGAGDSRALARSICESGLRYDLTVPLARVVVQHQSDIQFPFRRYQIGPVFRADRPQKGRYRQFTQCDADIVGSSSWVGDVEVLKLYAEVFDTLGLKVVIRVNHRKLMQGMLQHLSLGEQSTAVLGALDKMDKIGEEGVHKALISLGISEIVIEEFMAWVKQSDHTVAHNEAMQEGRDRLEKIIDVLGNAVQFDASLARGLDYYTGMVAEVVSSELEFGSIGGGGRYDELTKVFGGQNLPGVGISFGLDRIVDVMDTLERWPNASHGKPLILFIHFDEPGMVKGWEYVQQLRSKGIPAELYPDIAKAKKQLKYADQRGFTYVAMLGDEELSSNTIMVKFLDQGSQSSMTFDELITALNTES